MKKAKKILLVILLSFTGLLAVLFVSACVFRAILGQGVMPEFSQGRSTDPVKIVLVGQKSAFKDSVVAAVRKRFETEQVYLKGFDVGSLPSLALKDWDGVLVLTTVEMGKLPRAANQFLRDYPGAPPFRLLVTAGDGVWKDKPKDLDCLTGASSAATEQLFVQEMTDFIGKTAAHKK